MTSIYVLYNPFSGNGTGEDDARILEVALPEPASFFDMTKITNYAAFLGGMERDGILVIAGGDGTLNRFVNATVGIDIPQEILYFPIGTGNDFARDLGKRPYEDPFPVSAYLQDLPTVLVKGKTYRFLNGVGFGIDGYCCQVGDKIRAETPNKKINYTGIAIKGLLFHYKPTNATVIVDGETHEFKKVWIAPTMKGWYYGGGMKPAPAQDRTAPDNKVSVMLFHGTGKLKTLCIFPSLFKGEHVKYTNHITIFTGKKITVKFDEPRALQVDGETVLGVTEYTVQA